MSDFSAGVLTGTALGLLLAQAALIGLIPAQPVDWLAERVKRAAAVVWLAVMLVAQLFGKKAL